MDAGNVVTVLFDSEQESDWNESDEEESMEDTSFQPTDRLSLEQQGKK